MKRVFLPLIVGVPVLLLVLFVYSLVAPYVHGKHCMREMYVVSNVLVGFKRPYVPVVVSSREQLQKIVDAAKREWLGHPHLGHWDNKIDGEATGLNDFEKSMANFDFSAEVLVLIPRTHGHQDEIGLRNPFLRSRKLTVGVWWRDMSWGQARLPASRTDCFGVVVKRDSVDEIQISGADGGTALLKLR